MPPASMCRVLHRRKGTQDGDRHVDRECGNACAFLQAWLYAPDIRVQNHVDPDRELLGQRLEEVVEHPVAAIADERLHFVQAVLTFYER